MIILWFLLFTIVTVVLIGWSMRPVKVQGWWIEPEASKTITEEAKRTRSKRPVGLSGYYMGQNPTDAVDRILYTTRVLSHEPSIPRGWDLVIWPTNEPLRERQELKELDTRHQLLASMKYEPDPDLFFVQRSAHPGFWELVQKYDLVTALVINGKPFHRAPGPCKDINGDPMC